MMCCKHPGCLKRAIVYERDGIKVVACKEHFKILIDYLIDYLREIKK